MKNSVTTILFVFVSFVIFSQNDIVVEGGGVAPSNTTTEIDGMIRFVDGSFEFFNSGTWVPLIDSTSYSPSPWTQNSNGIFYSNGNIGVYDSDPVRPISATGPIRSSRDADELEFNEFGHGGANAYMNWSGDGNLDFRYDGLDRLSLTQNAWLGLKTDNPGAQFHINSSGLGGTDYGFRLGGSGKFGIDASGVVGGRLTVDSLGRVGLGTNNPQHKLHLTGSGNIFLDNGITSVTLNGYTSGAAGGVIYQIDPKPANDSTAAVVRLFRSTNSSANHALMIMRGNNTTQNNHKFSTKDDSYMSAISGNLGLGTTTPSSKLTILDDKRQSLTIKTKNNLLENGIAFQNAGTAYTWNMFRSDAGNNNAHLIFAGGDADANIGLLPERMRITDIGNVAIGTTDPQGYKLAVKGNIGAEEIEVRTNYWADFVFDADYDLLPLGKVKSFIDKNGHLPDVPSESEAISNPLNLGEMNVLLLQKIEEMTLYLIEMEEKMEDQNTLISKLEKQIQNLNR